MLFHIKKYFHIMWHCIYLLCIALISHIVHIFIYSNNCYLIKLVKMSLMKIRLVNVDLIEAKRLLMSFVRIMLLYLLLVLTKLIKIISYSYNKTYIKASSIYTIIYNIYINVYRKFYSKCNYITMIIFIYSICYFNLLFAKDGGGKYDDFNDIYILIQGYLKGSLGNVILIVCLLGVVISLAGFASIKVMFSLLVVAMVIRFGPDILTKMVGQSMEIGEPDSGIYQYIHLYKTQANTGDIEIIGIFSLCLIAVILKINNIRLNKKKQKNTI